MNSHPGPTADAVLSKTLLDSLCSPTTTEFERMAAIDKLLDLPNGCWGRERLLVFLMGAAKSAAQRLRASTVDWEDEAVAFAENLRHLLVGKTVDNYRGYFKVTLYHQILAVKKAHRREMLSATEAAYGFYAAAQSMAPDPLDAREGEAPTVVLNWGLLRRIDAALHVLTPALQRAADDAICNLPEDLREVAARLDWSPRPSAVDLTDPKARAAARQQRHRLHLQGLRRFGPTKWRFSDH